MNKYAKTLAEYGSICQKFIDNIVYRHNELLIWLFCLNVIHGPLHSNTNMHERTFHFYDHRIILFCAFSSAFDLYYSTFYTQTKHHMDILIQNMNEQSMKMISHSNDAIVNIKQMTRYEYHSNIDSYLN